VTGAIRGVILGLVVASALASCIVRRFTGPTVTGTCNGACDHYVECKPGHLQADSQRCRAECPEVFSDREALAEFERMTCKDAVEYVDGAAPKSASER
jgi:hypothetical protein